MARADAINMRTIVGAKTNEHNSAIGRTPPFILHFLPGATIADDLLAYEAVVSGVRALMVPGALSSASLCPAAANMVTAAPSYQSAGGNDDWPESNPSRMAKILLGSTVERNVIQSVQIPYLADATSEDDIAAFFATIMGVRDLKLSPTSTQLLNKVTSITINRRG